MPNTDRQNRPLSPHLMIYRPQLTSMTSIFVRVTGNALIVGIVLIIAWLMAAAHSQTAFDFVNGILASWFGLLILIPSLWALWYHTLGGVRHLIWDMGLGLDVATSEKMGLGMIFGSFVLTALTLWIL
ncbi:MAG: succinate dehydrogenase, cytochrome b556 subunit [Planktomarina sp.]